MTIKFFANGLWRLDERARLVKLKLDTVVSVVDTPIPSESHHMTTHAKLSWDECCALIQEHYKGASAMPQCARAYASNSEADLAESARDYGYTLDQTIRIQAAYVLCNIVYWRGDVATLVRANLKRITGQEP